MGGGFLRFVLTISVSVQLLSVCGGQYIQPSPALVGTGGNITLSCQHPLHPNAGVRWGRGDLDSLSYSFFDDARLTTSGSELSISHFKASDLAGRYWCLVDQVEEGGVQTTVSCPVEVQHARIPAGLLVQPEDTTAYEGTDVVLRCSPHPSVPPAVIAWTRNGVLVDPASSNQFSLSPSGNLYILNVSRQQEGTYRCMATNPVTGAHRRSHEIQLTVEVPFADMVVAPTFAVEPVILTSAVAGSRVVLECSGRGYPQPLESWSMAHARMFPAGARVLATGELVIESVALHHAGIYICRIRTPNHILIAERCVEVIVNVPPRVTLTPPPVLVVQRENTSAVISCSATASDVQQLVLLHNGSILHTATGQNVVSQVTPPLLSIGASHTFQCIAINSYGCDNSISTVMYVEDTLPTGETAPTPTGSTSFTPEENGSGNVFLVPMLDLKTTSPIIRAYLGESHVAVCEVTGPPDQELTLTWSQGGSGDLNSEPIDGIIVRPSMQLDGVLVSALDFQTVRKDHNGSYFCHASIKGHNIQLKASISLFVLDTPTTTPITTVSPTSTSTPTPPPTSLPTTTTESQNRPPYRLTNLQARQNPQTGDLEVSWNDPHTSEHMILGFKLNWDLPGSVLPSARASLAKKTNSINEYQYTIHRNYFMEHGAVEVYVWAYNIFGDGPFAVVHWAPADTTFATTSVTTLSTTVPSTSTPVSQPTTPAPSPSTSEITITEPTGTVTIGTVTTDTATGTEPTDTEMTGTKRIADEEDGSSQAEVALVYSVIFGSIIVGCALLVVVILALKYVQWTRRDNDKVTDYREKSKQEFDRLSVKRSSVMSVKSSRSTTV